MNRQKRETVSLRCNICYKISKTEDSGRAQFREKCAILNNAVRKGIPEKGVAEKRFEDVERATF